MKKFLVLALLVSVGTFAFATPIAAPNAFQKFMEVTTGAGKQTVGFGSNGVVTVSPGVPTIHTDGGLPVATGSGSFRNPSGNPVPVTGTARVPAAEVAKATGRAVARAVAAIAAPIGVGLAIYDLGIELGYLFSKSSSGALTVQKSDPLTCSVGPCIQYLQTAGGIVGSWKNTRLAACLDWAPKWSSANATYNLANVSYDPSQTNSCKADVMTKDGALYYAGNYYAGLTDRSVAPSPAAYMPSNSQEFIDAVAAKSGWPAGSAVRHVIAEDNAVEAEKIKTVPQATTGPATSAGTSTTTNNTTNNTTKVETVTHNHTYQGDVVTTTNITNVVTTNNTTGAVTESSTSTSTAPAPITAPHPEKVIVCGLPNTPACKIDETGTKTDAPEVATQSKADIDAVKSTAVAEIDKAASIVAPSWSFSFQFPTGCAPYTTGIRGFILNVCPYQSSIHGLLSAIWAASTLFAMLGMVGRTIRGE